MYDTYIQTHIQYVDVILHAHVHGLYYVSLGLHYIWAFINMVFFFDRTCQIYIQKRTTTLNKKIMTEIRKLGLKLLVSETKITSIRQVMHWDANTA